MQSLLRDNTSKVFKPSKTDTTHPGTMLTKAISQHRRKERVWCGKKRSNWNLSSLLDRDIVNVWDGGFFLKLKNPAVTEDYWSQTRRYLNCVDFEQHPEGVPEPLLPHLLPITTYLLQRNPHIKKNKEERKVSKQLTLSQHTGISHKLTGSTVQKSNTKCKKELSRKWLLTSADNSDQTPSQAWAYGREGREQYPWRGDVCVRAQEDFSVF